MEDQIDHRWRTSSYSGNGGGNCVEVAADGRVLIRDSQDRAGTVLQFSPAAWRRFAVLTNDMVRDNDRGTVVT